MTDCQAVRYLFIQAAGERVLDLVAWAVAMVITRGRGFDLHGG